MAREQEKLSKDVLAVLDKKTNDLRLVSEMNEQTGRVQHREHGSGRSAQSLSFDSRTVLGTFFENLRNQYGRPSDPGLKFLPDRYRKTRPYPRLHHPSPRRQGSERLPGQGGLRLRTQQRGAYRQVR